MLKHQREREREHLSLGEYRKEARAGNIDACFLEGPTKGGPRHNPTGRLTEQEVAHGNL